MFVTCTEWEALFQGITFPSVAESRIGAFKIVTPSETIRRVSDAPQKDNSNQIEMLLRVFADWLEEKGDISVADKVRNTLTRKDRLVTKEKGKFVLITVKSGEGFLTPPTRLSDSSSIYELFANCC